MKTSPPTLDVMKKAVPSDSVRRVKRGAATTVVRTGVHQALDPKVKEREPAEQGPEQVTTFTFIPTVLSARMIQGPLARRGWWDATPDPTTPFNSPTPFNCCGYFRIERERLSTLGHDAFVRTTAVRCDSDSHISTPRTTHRL